jgi:hypothetical protein
MNETTRMRPSWWYCLLGVPFLLLGAGLFVYILVYRVSHMTDSLTQVVVPGRAELSLRGRRTYTVFVEEQSVLNGRVYSTTESIAGLECRVKAMPRGEAVRIRTAGMNTTYTIGGRSGRSALEFVTRDDGRYELACDYGENRRGPEVVVAVGSGLGMGILYTIAACLGSMLAGIVLCLAVVFVVAMMRDHNRRRILAAAAR